MEPLQLYENLLESEAYNSWKEHHPQGFLSHFFSSLSVTLGQKTPWEIGFYDPESKKISIFSLTEKDNFLLKQEDDVFKQETTEVEELLPSEIKITFEKAKEIYTQNKEQAFPNETAGDGFIILQQINSRTIWNFTFISKSLKFLNTKISAVDGEIISQEAIEVISRQEPGMKKN